MSHKLESASGVSHKQGSDQGKSRGARSEWDKGVGGRIEGLGKAFKSVHGDIVYAALDQPHGGVMATDAVGELRLSQSKVTTAKTNLFADQTVHRFLRCRHAV